MPHFLFVTGKLAEPALRRTLAALAPGVGFDYHVAVLPITVAALMTTPWIARHLTPEPGFDRAILPGLCGGDLDLLSQAWSGLQVVRGPKDLVELPEYFGSGQKPPPDLSQFDIQILAELNHAPRLTRADLLKRAQQAKLDGADIIDLGCDPGSIWDNIGDAVRLLRDEGMRVSVDTFCPREAQAAARAGAELVLSVNLQNREAASDWGCEVVAVPDVPDQLQGLDDTIDLLIKKNIPFRIDPILEPIAFGFAESLGRYLEARRRYPEAEMLMGVGNLTELTDADSAGINVVLAGFCQEQRIRSVLTTEVLNSAHNSIRELDLARRLVAYACRQHVLPKRIEPNLVLLRDPKLIQRDPKQLDELAQQINDRNFRLFAESGLIHVINGSMHLQGTDPFALFAEMSAREKIDPAHAFYLGYEFAKAVTALTLNKNYVQDQALRWGYLTNPEDSHRNKTSGESPDSVSRQDSDSGG